MPDIPTLIFTTPWGLEVGLPHFVIPRSCAWLMGANYGVLSGIFHSPGEDGQFCKSPTWQGNDILARKCFSPWEVVGQGTSRGHDYYSQPMIRRWDGEYVWFIRHSMKTVLSLSMPRKKSWKFSFCEFCAQVWVYARLWLLSDRRWRLSY